MTEAPEKRLERLQLIEGRRLALDASMWQVPVLTVAGQAFLLQVLASDDVDWWVASPVAAADVLASWAAGLSLLQQRSAERLHAEEVQRLAIAAGIGDPNLPRRRRLRAYKLWLATLVGFLIADLIALVATRVT